MFLLIVLALFSPFRQVSQEKIDALKQVTPLSVEVLGSRTFTAPPSGDSPGITYISVNATINGSKGWKISCLKEEGPHGSVPCVELLPGQYRATWIHKGEMIEVITFDARGEVERFFYDVEPLSDSTSASTDSAPPSQPKQINFKLPKGKKLEDYPLLLHIYASHQFSYESGFVPGSIDCSNMDSSIHCSSTPAGPLHRTMNGLFAKIDGQIASVSCTEKSAFTSCLAPYPGLYAARWKDDKKRQLKVVIEFAGGSVKEVSFDAEISRKEPSAARPMPQSK